MAPSIVSVKRQYKSEKPALAVPMMPNIRVSMGLGRFCAATREEVLIDWIPSTKAGMVIPSVIISRTRPAPTAPIPVTKNAIALKTAPTSESMSEARDLPNPIILGFPGGTVCCCEL